MLIMVYYQTEGHLNVKYGLLSDGASFNFKNISHFFRKPGKIFNINTTFYSKIHTKTSNITFLRKNIDSHNVCIH